MDLHNSEVSRNHYNAATQLLGACIYLYCNRRSCDKANQNSRSVSFSVCKTYSIILVAITHHRDHYISTKLKLLDLQAKPVLIAT